MKSKKGLTAQLKPLLPFLRPHYWQVGGIILFVVIQVVGNILISKGLGAALDAGLATDVEGFKANIYFILIAGMTTDVGFFLRTVLSGRLGEQICYAIRDSATKHLSVVKVSELKTSHSGEYVSRLSNDMNLIRSLFAFELQFFVRAPLQCLLSLGYMLLISWRVTLISLAVIPILMVISNRMSKPIGPESKAAQEKLAAVTALSQDAANGVTVTKAFNLRGVIGSRYRESSLLHAQAVTKLAGSQAVLRASSFLFNITPTLILFGVGGYEVVSNRLTLGSLIILLNLVGNLSWPLQAMIQAYGRVKASAAAVERVFAIFDLQRERSGGANPEPKADQLVMEFDNVGFSYGEGRQVFSGLHMKIYSGETVAVVGPSGAGKSTLLNLMQGLIEPGEGEIMVYGQPYSQLSLAGLRQLISYVPQEATLFDKSVRENIRLGLPTASDAEVEQAARQAFAHDFIMGLPQGYETVLGEEGTGLSGGQKQRIAIARAILKDAPILLLDEATSALDTESEARVQSAIESLSTERTMLIVAHRLSTIRRADRIIVLDGGRVVEEGTHEQLLESDGMYAMLYQKQFAAEDKCLAVARS